MKKKFFRITALCLCMVIITSGAFIALASNKENEDNKAVDNLTERKTTEPISESDVFKDETVYVIANADGTIQKIIVSDWIKNTLSNDKINDVTELENIENVKGDEEYTIGGNNTRVWDAQGNDIYYQGTIEKELPVNLSVSYMLNGEAISPEELIGKSGKVTIRFDYRNNQYETVNINGKEETIYVPFVMLTGMILDNNNFSNVEVLNGKIINDGERTVVIGLALPGLKESIGIDNEKFDIPSYVEITADVNDFSLGMTVTVATNALLNKIDTEKIESISDLTASITELDDAMTKLLDGSSALYGGLCTLLEKSNELINGIDSLADGVAKLKDGAYSIDDGAKKIYDGTMALSNGLDTLSANNDKLNNGAEKVFKMILSTAEAQLKAAGLSVPTLTVDNYASVLNDIIDSLDDKKVYNKALEQVTAAVEEKRDYIKAQVTTAVRTEVEASVTKAVKEQVLSQITEMVKEEVSAKFMSSVHENIEAQVIQAATGMDKASYEKAVSTGIIDSAVKNSIEFTIGEKMASKEIKSMIETNTDTQIQSESIQKMISQKADEQMETEQVKNIIKTKTDLKMKENDIQALIEKNTDEQIQKVVAENMTSDEIQAKLSTVSEGAKSVISLKASLDDYNTFYIGLKDYTAGVAQAASGTSDLKAGAGELQKGTENLYNGICSLYDGILTMKNGAPALVDGITQLKDGAMQLSDGLSRLNEEGVQKLIGKIDDAETLIDRVKAIITISKNYKSFAGISDDTEGDVKFIYKTEEIK